MLGWVAHVILRPLASFSGSKWHNKAQRLAKMRQAASETIFVNHAVLSSSCHTLRLVLETFTRMLIRTAFCENEKAKTLYCGSMNFHYPSNITRSAEFWKVEREVSENPTLRDLLAKTILPKLRVAHPFLSRGRLWGTNPVGAAGLLRGNWVG